MEMADRLRVREYGIVIGEYNTGPRNSITDIDDMKVGHCSLIRGRENLFLVVAL